MTFRNSSYKSSVGNEEAITCEIRAWETETHDRSLEPAQGGSGIPSKDVTHCPQNTNSNACNWPENVDGVNRRELPLIYSNLFTH